MLFLKDSVSIKGIQPEMVLGLVICYSVWELYTHGIPFVVTSVSDGNHSPRSLHYRGFAADIRTRDIGPQLSASIVTLFKKSLGKDFDVVLESDHIHVEFDPKTLTH